MVETVLNELRKNVDEFCVKMNNRIGDKFKLNHNDYDRPHSSFIYGFDVFGCELDVIYVFEEDTIYVHDVETDVDRIEITNVSNELNGLELVFEFVEKYSELHHFVTSSMECTLK